MYLSRAHCISPKRLTLWMPYLLLNLYTYWKGPRNHQLRQCLPKCCKRTHGSLYVPACDSRCIASWQFQLQLESLHRDLEVKWTPNSANMDTWHHSRQQFWEFRGSSAPNYSRKKSFTPNSAQPTLHGPCTDQVTKIRGNIVRLMQVQQARKALK